MRARDLGIRMVLVALAGLAWPAAAQHDSDLSAPVPELCAACHPDVDDWITGDGAHAPAALGQCFDCHSAHAARHEGLLIRAGTRLCLQCHDQLREALESGSIHDAVRQQGCLDCHDPHASGYPQLLVSESRELCFSCHGGLVAMTEAEHPHAPFTDGSCDDCHDAHVSDEWPLLDSAQGELCSMCHDLEEAAAREKHLGATLDENCTSCHDPHGSDRAGLLQESLHPPFEAEECEMCHDSGGGDALALNAPASELCLTCHDGVGGHPGSSAEGADCGSCHSPHGGSTPALLHSGTRHTCTECHVEVQEQFNEEKHAHTLSLDGQGCVGCHDPHAGKGRALLRKDEGLQNCNACHADHAVFSHPMGDGVNDPSREGKFVDCVSCHDPHGTRWAGFMVANASRDLCVRCHDQDDPHAAANPEEAGNVPRRDRRQR